MSPPAPLPNIDSPISRAEWNWLSVAMLCGAALRLGNLSQVAVEHFDEAVYASNLLFPPEQGGEYPFRQLYAPPLLPAAIEWTTIFGQMIMGDVPSWWPMLPTLLAGLVTIPSLWWIARRWFSPRAGIIAALVIAFHEFHAAYSRTALTDVPLALFVLWAVHGFWIALQTGRTRDAVIAGVFTSLAWWTKYNGWLPLAIAASGGVLWQIVTPPAERNWFRLGRTWSIGAATACVLWLPVLGDCQKIGGYEKVAENHRQYVTGTSRWMPHLIQGYESFDEFVGWISLAGVVLAGLIRWLPARCQVDGDRITATTAGRVLAGCLVGAWFCGLLLATPMYNPYSRLWLPWLLAASVLVAMMLSATRSWRIGSLADCYGTVLRLLGTGCGLMILCSAVSDRSSEANSAALEPRDSLSRAARQIRDRVANIRSPLIVVDSDPALWFHLRKFGSLAIPVNSFDFTGQRFDQPAYLILGPLAQRLESTQVEWQRNQHRFELVEDFPIHPSRVAMLDLSTPRDLSAHPNLRTPTVRLYRLRK